VARERNEGASSCDGPTAYIAHQGGSPSGQWQSQWQPCLSYQVDGHITRQLDRGLRTRRLLLSRLVSPWQQQKVGSDSIPRIRLTPTRSLSNSVPRLCLFSFNSVPRLCLLSLQLLHSYQGLSHIMIRRPQILSDRFIGSINPMIRRPDQVQVVYSRIDRPVIDSDVHMMLWESPTQNGSRSP